MDPRDFNRLADVLSHGTSSSEARSAISRAYYAVYHVAVETLKNVGISISIGPAGHGEVLRYLANSGDAEVCRMASDLSDFRRKRNDADYDLSNSAVEKATVAQSYVHLAERIISALDACQVEPRRSHIMADLAAYRNKLKPN